MTRPGPRPYECVWRAWHSDRHQPIRGSLIQEIFRVVNEVHSTSTKKNREWQEKLPLVVLKAEEIMYSKANSEGEYMDLKTLWDRTNDAINTIIRRDESTESGELLHPCIEAALNLGCTPIRSSRNQQNNAPMPYLNPTTPEAAGFLPRKRLGLSSDKVSFPRFSNSMKLIGNALESSTEASHLSGRSSVGGDQKPPVLINGSHGSDQTRIRCDLSLRLGPKDSDDGGLSSASDENAPVRDLAGDCYGGESRKRKAATAVGRARIRCFVGSQSSQFTA